MIFADSSFFIGIAREKDRWHKDALKIAKRNNEALLISDLIISESVTLVGSLESGKAGKILYEYFVDNCKIVFTDTDLLENAIEKFLMYDGTISLADATSVEIMHQFGIDRIISFDSDFDKVNGINRIH